jgi:two-component system NtrC family sensor kinase
MESLRSNGPFEHRRQIRSAQFFGRGSSAPGTVVMKLSLRARGGLVFLVLVAYVSVVGFVLTSERQKLLQLALNLEQLNAQEAALTKAGQAVDHSQLRVQGLLFAQDPASSYGDDLALDVELIQAGLQVLQKYFREFDDDIAHLGQEVMDLRQVPSRSGLVALQDVQAALDIRLNELASQLREQRKVLWENYYRVYDRMSLLAVTMNLIGVTIFGALITLFFTRLAWDIRKLGLRAADVVAGYRGAPLDVTRSDEIGELMEAVNRMQLELRRREQTLEISREQHFHREKMAAVGSLAAAVAHEINNPIAAIAGIARSMSETEGDRPATGKDSVVGGPQLILEQTQRISAISRQIAEFTRPRVSNPELLDLNALVRSTCRFIGYDQRLRNVDVVLELDTELPAINAVADHLTQVLMNLMINSADALEGITDRKPTINLETRFAAGEVVLIVRDNGHGMDAATMAHIFEESFSTKPADKGRGLGLFLCKALLERHGGRIEIASTPGRGAIVTVHLPLQTGTEA